MSAFLSRLSQTESNLQTALEFLTGSQSVSNPNPCFSTSVFTLLFFPMFYIHILTMKSLRVCWASVKVLYRLVTCLYLR